MGANAPSSSPGLCDLVRGCSDVQENKETAEYLVNIR